jgi:mRNA-degrading endonuclease RelE of RelBE toxin-antitoxin system
MDIKMKQHLLEDIGGLENFTGLKTDLDIAKMKGQKNFYRLRTQRFRTIFCVEPASKIILILKIEKRENVYE